MNENATEFDEDAPYSDVQLFLHKKRPQWGPALLVQEEMTKRSYQFQDGQLRKLKKGFYHMMEPFDAGEARAEVIVEDLEELHEVVTAERSERQELMAQPPVMSFADQVKVFTHLYPGGFQDPAYLEAWRASKRRTSKRHIDTALRAAPERLSAEALDALIAQGDYAGVMDALLKTLALTSLAPPSKVTRPLEAVDASRHEPIALALRDLLHGDGSYKDRFRAWVFALSDSPSLTVNWAMATLPSALLRPNKHVLVKRGVFRLQARILSHGAGTRKRPTPRGYKRMRKLNEATREALVEAGLTPTDSFDIRCFIWETLRPKGQEILGQLGRRSVA